MELQTLMEIYDRYIQRTAKVLENASAFDGFWGWGEDPKNDPCHMQFYEEVESFVAELLASAPSEERAFQTAEQLLCAPAEHKGEEVFWYMFAAQGQCKGLIPLLSRGHCQQLLDFYDEHYPRRDRLPVQKEVYKLLKKAAGNR